jgi:hypothetical protein
VNAPKWTRPRCKSTVLTKNSSRIDAVSLSTGTNCCSVSTYCSVKRERAWVIQSPLISILYMLRRMMFFTHPTARWPCWSHVCSHVCLNAASCNICRSYVEYEDASHRSDCSVSLVCAVSCFLLVNVVSCSIDHPPTVDSVMPCRRQFRDTCHTPTPWQLNHPHKMWGNNRYRAYTRDGTLRCRLSSCSWSCSQSNR